MKSKSIITAVSAILIMTGCTANKNKEQVMEEKQVTKKNNGNHSRQHQSRRCHRRGKNSRTSRGA